MVLHTITILACSPSMFGFMIFLKGLTNHRAQKVIFVEGHHPNFIWFGFEWVILKNLKRQKLKNVSWAGVVQLLWLQLCSSVLETRDRDPWKADTRTQNSTTVIKRLDILFSCSERDPWKADTRTQNSTTIIKRLDILFSCSERLYT